MDGRDGPAGAEESAPAIPWFLRSRWQLVLCLLLGLGVPFAVFTAAVVSHGRSTLEAQATTHNTALARLAAEVVAADFEGLMGAVEALGRRPDLADAVRAGDADAAREVLHEFVRHVPRFDRAFLTTPEGVEWADWPHDPAVIGKSFAHRDWFRGVAASGATYVSEVYVRAGSPREEIVAVTTPVRGPAGDVLAYLVAQQTLVELTRRIASIRPADEGLIALIDHRNQPAMSASVRETWEIAPLDDAVLQRMHAEDGAAVVRRDTSRGDRFLVSYARVPSIGWIVWAQQPTSTVYAPMRALQSAVLGLAALCLASMFGLGVLCLDVVRRQHVAAQQLQALKDRLSGMIVHDLRSPLTSTVLSLDMLSAEASLSETMRPHVERASTSVQRVLALTDNLVDVMRMEEGVLTLSLAQQDLGELVRAKVEEYTSLANKRSVRLGHVLPRDPLETRVDAALLTRVLENLIANAIQHTNAGGKVEVRLDAVPREDQVVLSVIDDGEGIPADELPRLFKKFARAAGQGNASARGAGLGLVFCRMAVELHGGTIEVHSEQREGSTFRVTLPRA